MESVPTELDVWKARWSFSFRWICRLWASVEAELPGVHEMEVAFWAGILQVAKSWFAVRLAVGSFAFANLLSQHHLEIFNTMAVINLWIWFS